LAEVASGVDLIRVQVADHLDVVRRKELERAEHLAAQTHKHTNRQLLPRRSRASEARGTPPPQDSDSYARLMAVAVLLLRCVPVPVFRLPVTLFRLSAITVPSFRLPVPLFQCPYRYSDYPYRYSDYPYRYSDYPYGYSDYPYRYSDYPLPLDRVDRAAQNDDRLLEAAVSRRGD
jgi:hypothetical protein